MTEEEQNMLLQYFWFCLRLSKGNTLDSDAAKDLVERVGYTNPMLWENNQ